jgi:hypothetical protein
MWITGAQKSARFLSTGDAQAGVASYRVYAAGAYWIRNCLSKRKISYPQGFGSLIITN